MEGNPPENREKPILQRRLPHDPWGDPALARLPGMKPVAPGEWLWVDEAYDRQMAERRRLIATRPHDVLASDEAARDAAEELLGLVVGELAGKPGFMPEDGAMRCPDGQRVALAHDTPHGALATLGALVQEDFCILERRGNDAHVLTAAVLCFPASWTLSQKFLRPLDAIHGPVVSYDSLMARRVGHMLNMLRPGRPLWRANALFYRDPALFQPRSEAAPRCPEEREETDRVPYIRSERQTLLRLPGTGAIVFSIHTWLVMRESLTPAQRVAMEAGLRR